MIAEILNLLERMQGGAPAEAKAAAPSPKAYKNDEATGESMVFETAAPALKLQRKAHRPEATPLIFWCILLRIARWKTICAFMLVTKLETIGQVISTIPEELNANKDASSIISQNGFYCSLMTDLSAEEVVALAKGTLSVYTVEFVNGLPSAQSKPAATTVAAESDTAKTSQAAAADTADNGGDAGRGKAGKQNLINVDLNKLDTLMDLVGEIVITESMVSGSSDLAGLELDNFNRSARQLRKLTDELQDIVMSIRMAPIAATFQKMRRIVRDMGKKAQ